MQGVRVEVQGFGLQFLVPWGFRVGGFIGSGLPLQEGSGFRREKIVEKIVQ